MWLFDTLGGGRGGNAKGRNRKDLADFQKNQIFGTCNKFVFFSNSSF